MALTRAVGPMAQPALGTEQATTSGTSVDFTGIPAGTKQIIVTVEGVSTNGTGAIKIQLGDSGGVETTGDTGRHSQIRASLSPFNTLRTDGFWLTGSGALASEQLYSGQAILTLKDASDNT